MEALFTHIGIVPQRIISDFDLNWFGGSAREYLYSLLVHVSAACLKLLPAPSFFYLLNQKWVSSSLSKLFNGEKRIWENLWEELNLESIFARCHAIIALITVEDRCDIIPGNTHGLTNRKK
jgi:hypothetical protein